ncbi:hypothetical protein RND71_033047 [Anisodus tanguticus]|uniref:Uncharacterized protein n=1 Tax=Anisodus tanguticus TaxID=243964 RepID=A0AAE1R802_9SOLA|nr:hypothetical protein RND71_033047 [Anisodus tanguticus]
MMTIRTLNPYPCRFINIFSIATCSAIAYLVTTILYSLTLSNWRSVTHTTFLQVLSNITMFVTFILLAFFLCSTTPSSSVISSGSVSKLAALSEG